MEKFFPSAFKMVILIIPMTLIYRNIWIYRTVMNVIYCGKYRRRFDDITELLQENDSTVMELCFGDTCIAEYCRNAGKHWVGFDMNGSFVAHARKKGFSAFAADLSKQHSLPSADVCIIAGSLYHFHSAMDAFLSLMLASAKTVILSEPIKNMTNHKGLIGTIAACASDAGKGKEPFRFTRATLTGLLDSHARKMHFSYEVVSEAKDLLIRISHENH